MISVKPEYKSLSALGTVVESHCVMLADGGGEVVTQIASMVCDRW